MTHYTLRLLVAVLAAVSCGAPAHKPAQAANGDVSAPALPPGLGAAIGASGELQAAEDAIEAGHPWKATQILEPLLRDPQRRSPAAVLLAARAAAGWRGWREVDSLLAPAVWVDTAFGGDGRELLARSALEQSHDGAALTNARAALAHASTAQSRATRMVYVARAWDRGNQPDSAAAAYRAAARLLPRIADWLALRAAGSEPDSAARARDYAAVRIAAARARVPWTEAQARERFSDVAGAADRFAALGQTAKALSLRLTVAPDSASRLQLQSQLLGYVQQHAGTAGARDAVDALDRAFTQLSPSQELIVARSSARSGPATRAVTGFARALAGHSTLTAADRLSYAQALAAAGHRDEAARQFALVTGSLAATAAYQNARLLLNAGNNAALETALNKVVASYPRDASAAPPSLYLLADLATDAGNDSLARATFLRVARQFPTTSWADDARFRAGIISFIQGNSRDAAKQFDSLVIATPRSAEAAAARYWSARALADMGDSAQARARWTQIATSDPTSYYAILSTRRLHGAKWAPAAASDSVPHVADVDQAIERAALLETLGMDAEARFEYDALESAAPSSPARLLATAQALHDAGQSVRSIRLANRLVNQGERDARSYRLLYPVLDRQQITDAARAHSLDPGFVAGLIRQESSFNPNAVSVAGARGLMQVMPAVGEQLARAAKYPVWDPVLLFDPDVNVQLGTAHLAGAFAQDSVVPRVLAAYNAGATRVGRWATKGGVSDPEIFAERIPFTETRDYVRVVQRNAVLYDALYSW